MLGLLLISPEERMKQQYRVIYEDLYDWFRYHRDYAFVCFYCGEPSDTVDHCPPISRVDDYRALGLENEHYLKVGACNQCNSVLGDSLQESLIERERCLKLRLEYKYRKILKTPDWKSVDILRHGKNLKSYIRKSMQQKKHLMKRLDYNGGVQAYIDSLEAADPYDEAINDE